jgi:VCBS repeat-containing protein
LVVLLGFGGEALAQLGPPLALDDPLHVVDEDDTLIVNALLGVLLNDLDPDLGPITAVLISDVANGTLNLAADGSFTYTPDQDFNGQDSFTYEAVDGVDPGGPTSIATATITVNAVNDPPTIDSAAVTAASEGTPYTYNITASDLDGDALTLSAPTRPAWLSGFVDNGNGTATLSGTPAQANVGPHNVTVRVFDGTVNVDQAFVVTVAAVNDPPTIDRAAVTVAERNSTPNNTIHQTV